MAEMSFRSRVAGLSLLSVFLWRFTGGSGIIRYQDFIFILVHKTKINDNKLNVTNVSIQPLGFSHATSSSVTDPY